MADLYITGQFNSTAEITAVSIGSQVMHMLTVIIVGLAMGTTVIVGQSVGEKNNGRISAAAGNSFTLFFILSVLAAFVLSLFTDEIVELISTPKEACKSTGNYLRICFLGIPFITGCNIISAIFRGLGDSKTPMIFVSTACLLNIVLDYIFLGCFGLGASGAAISTVAAQIFSVVFSLCFIKKSWKDISPKKGDFKLRRKIYAPLLKVGIPVALQDGFIQVAFIIITIIVNKRGLSDAAAVGIVEKIICFIFLVPSSMLSAVSALAAQNFGAGKIDRAEKTLIYAASICFVFGLSVAIVFQFIAEPVVALFDGNPSVIKAGGEYLRSYIVDTMFAGLHFCFSGYFCALGKSWISFMHNTISILLVRIPGAYFLSLYFVDTIYPLGFAAMTGSALSAAICFWVFLILKRKMKRQNSA
ncbi:MAG: MATE family efflux transporter [Treponema sp.]|nr:MATE family efflux transporter [Candidatus Treponema equifaecale]